MRIFKANTTRSIAIEAGIGVAATLGIAVLSGVPYPRAGGARSASRSGWSWLVIAARYGTRGLAIVIPHRLGGAGARQRRRRAGAGARHAGAADRAGRARRHGAGRLDRVRQRAPRAGARGARSPSSNGAWPPTPTTIGDLRRAALALRARNDRLDLSLTFLRNIARRLHGSDAEAAAQAALELIVARIGARAASVEMLAGGELRPLAVLGIWNRDRARSHGARGDEANASRCARWSWPKAAPTTATSRRRSPTPAGVVRGVIAARGVPGGRLQHGRASRSRRHRGLGVARALRRAARGRGIAGEPRSRQPAARR